MTSPANAKVSYLTDPDSARGRLLSKAAHLFRVKGFERTTVRDLAREIGIQSGSIFHHFRTKEEILRAVMEEAILYNTERMEQQVNAAPNAREKVLALIRCELESVLGLTGEAMSVLVYEWRSLSDESQAYILNLRDKYEAIWLTALESAKADGLIDADTFVLRRFLTGALSWTTTWYKPGRELSIQALAEQALLLAIKISTRNNTPVSVFATVLEYRTPAPRGKDFVGIDLQQLVRPICGYTEMQGLLTFTVTP